MFESPLKPRRRLLWIFTGIILVELCGGTKRNPEAVKRWHEVRHSTYQGVEAKTLWHGRCDHHILGTVTPDIDDVLVTWFPDAIALDQAMNDPKRADHLNSVQPYVAYTANTLTGFLPELR